MTTTTNQNTSKPSREDCRAMYDNINDMLCDATMGSLSTTYREFLFDEISDKDNAAYLKMYKIYFKILMAVNQLVEATADCYREGS